MATTISARTLYLAQGLQQGVEVPLSAGAACIIGSSPEQCSVALLDDGVAARRCALTLDMHGHVSCTAFDAPVRSSARVAAG